LIQKIKYRKQLKYITYLFGEKMCGICGFCGHEDKDLIKKMTNILSHRGPDAHGYFTDKNICLGHRRLSIIDLSEKGRQPLFNEDNSICIVLNGEIYNYKELRAKLEVAGHRFSSNTDTEVIVHGYEEYGNKIASLLNGDFAFAIYDSTKKQLYLARDYAGIKPLYYYISDNKTSRNKFLFASEIKSILQDTEVKKEIDYDSFYDFLTLRYVPGEKTLFKGIKKLLPGHYAVYANAELSVEKYWDINFLRV
jgi:asparagine synthase (glutamine-hydrolysing)